MKVLRGPANFSSNEEWGLLVDGFDSSPAVMMTYNPPRYMNHIDAAGFTKGAVYSNFTRKSDLFRALLERETARRTTALRGAIEAVPLELLPDVAGEMMRDPDLDERDRNTLVIEFWLAAMRDPSLREPLASALGNFGGAIDAKLAEAGRRPGLDGWEIARIMDALAVGLRMHQGLKPDGRQHLLFAKAVHKLLADEPPPEHDRERA